MAATRVSASLINLLPVEKFNIIISGVEAEKQDAEKLVSLVKPVFIIALLDLKQFIALI